MGNRTILVPEATSPTSKALPSSSSSWVHRAGGPAVKSMYSNTQYYIYY